MLWLSVCLSVIIDTVVLQEFGQTSLDNSMLVSSSSISSSKKQLSKFGGHLVSVTHFPHSPLSLSLSLFSVLSLHLSLFLQMVQVSGNLKMYVPKGEVRPRPLGLIAECRLIESSSSILEVSIPQSSFTSTTSMDLKILSLDTK